MKGSTRLGVVALSFAATLGCGGGTRVAVPPRIDLQQHEILAIIQFTTTNKGELAPLTTQRFVEEIRLDQGMIRIIELGTRDEALAEVDKKRLDPSAYKQLGQEYDVATIFVGELIVSDIRPAVSITTDLSKLGASADVDATLTVNMVETATGASIWSRSASVTKRVGNVSLFDGDVDFDAEDPEGAYGELVDALVFLVTEEFKVTYARR
jgi:hypothetical protein